MTNQIHRAVQYLATAGISFLEKKEDDSHTNLGFNSEKGFLESRPLNKKGDKIVFDYQQFSLHWLANERITHTFLLDGKTHQEVVKWITEITDTLEGNKRYAYGLHYNLPYQITTDFRFQMDSKRLLELRDLRTLANSVLQSFLENNQLSSEIRIWPHHFDTGAFVKMNGKNELSIGLGLAIPDSVVDEHYFYLSGYQGHTAIDTSSFKQLTNGKWCNNGFKGAVLPTTEVNQNTAVEFLNEAFDSYY